MDDSLHLRWLGVAGFALTLGDRVLAVDPFFSRFPFHRLWLGRVRPDPALAPAILPRCHHILVSHAHWDHLLDVPEVIRHTGAAAYGSANTCRLLRLLGVPARLAHEVHAGDALALGPFTVDVLPGEHGTALGRPIFAGPLPSGLRPPLRARDYRMDECFSFLIEAGGVRLLHWGRERPAPVPRAHVLLLGLHRPRAWLLQLLEAVRPRLVIPMHWDDLFRSLSQPLRPMLAPPALAWPPLRRMDPGQFTREVEALAPGVRVLVPEVMRVYHIGKEV